MAIDNKELKKKENGKPKQKPFARRYKLPNRDTKPPTKTPIHQDHSTNSNPLDQQEMQSHSPNMHYPSNEATSPGAFPVHPNPNMGSEQTAPNDDSGTTENRNQYQQQTPRRVDGNGADEPSVITDDVYNVPDAFVVAAKDHQQCERVAILGMLLTACIIIGVVTVSVLLTRPVTSPVVTLSSSLSPDLSHIPSEPPSYIPTSSPTTGLSGSAAEKPFDNGTVSEWPSDPPSNATLSMESTLLPSIVTITDEQSAKLSQAAITDKPSATPSQATITDEPSAPPSQATIIVPSSTKAKFCLLIDTHYNVDSNNDGLVTNTVRALVTVINTTSPESLYSIFTVGSSVYSVSAYQNATHTLGQLHTTFPTTTTATATDLGFDKCQETFDFTDKWSKVIIIFTNGAAYNSTLADDAADAAKAKNIKIVCIGIGTDIQFDTLDIWATNPQLS